ncbi:MAG TPA: glycosyltransferase, partial [Methanocorpusculum sp.]|nr:glycosyltransferase [Methanocorpusculum sp.]
PSITVVIPLYNKVNEVKRAIDSVFSQTVQDFELIVIDGGSTDGSLDVIKQYEYDSRYHLIHQKSKGVSDGRNQGIVAAASDLIAFLDADDEWLPDFLEKILILRNKFPYAGLYGTGFLYCRVDHFLPSNIYGSNLDEEYIILSSYFKVLLSNKSIFCQSSSAIPKNIFKKVGLYNTEYNYGEDWELFNRIAMEFDVAYCTTPHTIYHLVADNKLTVKYCKIPHEHSAFWEYVNKLPKTKLAEYDKNKLDDINFYLESCELDTARGNIIAGNTSFAKENLKNVKSPYFRKRFLKYRVLMNMPFNLGQKIELSYEKFKKIIDPLLRIYYNRKNDVKYQDVTCGSKK